MFEYVQDVGLTWPQGRSERAYTDHIQIHHTVGDYSTPAKWKALHEKRIAVDHYRGIEYSFGVNAAGDVFGGRGLQYKHGAVKNSLTKDKNGVGAADRSVAITLIGDMRNAGMPTAAQLNAALRLAKDVMGTYGLASAQVLGHREIPLAAGGTYPTLCPVIDMDAFRARLDSADPDLAPDPVPDPVLPALYRYIGATFVNLRTGPGVQYAAVGRLLANEQLIALTRKEGWTEIILHQQRPMLRGWCISDFLRRMT